MPDFINFFDERAPYSGGWLSSLLNQIRNCAEINLHVLFPSNKFPCRKCIVNGVVYYEAPLDNTLYLKKIVSEINPYLVHVHGTELPLGIRVFENTPNSKKVISIQGLVKTIHRHYLDGLDVFDVLRSISFRDLVKANTLFNQKSSYKRRIPTECKYLEIADVVLGRTLWDRAHVYAINPRIKYIKCNETLREQFYTAPKWNYSNCKRHTIFVSQATYPIKGLHILIKAIALLVNRYPELVVRVAGEDILSNKSVLQRLKQTGYGRLVSKLINKHGLENNVEFIGVLDESAIIREYLNCNIFVSASSIENGSNSLGEAQILGVPYIASYVGGVTTTLMGCNPKNLYQFSEYEILAALIDRKFRDITNDDFEESISNAELIYNRETCKETILGLYLD